MPRSLRTTRRTEVPGPNRRADEVIALTKSLAVKLLDPFAFPIFCNTKRWAFCDFVALRPMFSFDASKPLPVCSPRRSRKSFARKKRPRVVGFENKRSCVPVSRRIKTNWKGKETIEFFFWTSSSHHMSHVPSRFEIHSTFRKSFDKKQLTWTWPRLAGDVFPCARK